MSDADDIRDQIQQAMFDMMSTRSGGCSHRHAVPVEDLLGERVAALCPDCDTQLPAEWAKAEEPYEPLPASVIYETIKEGMG